jgi:VIT1/CCC1 family predicted Fe2+/Mn2+ transporter
MLDSTMRWKHPADNDGEQSQAIFGTFDGLTSAIGVVVASLLQNNLHTLVVVAAGLATAAAIGMGAGEWLGDPTRNLRRSFIMAFSTAFGAFLPAIPFIFLSKIPAIIVAVVLCLVTALIIGSRRGRGVKPLIETLIILMVVTVITTIVSILAGKLVG